MPAMHALVVLVIGLAPLTWREVCPTPPGWCPQGLAASDGRLLLSAYRGAEECSAVFGIRTEGEDVRFEKLFDMPREARHTSGLSTIPGRPDRLFAVDYRSGLIYLLDLPGSCRTGQAVVLASCPTELRGPSTCCVPRLADGQWLLLVGEYRLLGPGKNVLFEFHAGTSGPGRTARVEPFVRRHALTPTFTNRGYVQGAKFHDGFVYEAGNRIGGASYLVRYRLEDALAVGHIPVAGDRGAAEVEQYHSPTMRLIEDIAFFQDHLWATDEGLRRLYRTPLPLAANRGTHVDKAMNMHKLFRAMMFSTALAGLQEVRGQTFSFDPVNQEVQVVMKEMDDIGFVLVLNAEGAILAAKCEWRPTLTGGERGQASVNLRPFLVPGDNIVIIGCFNKQWDGPGGQSSYDFRINTGPPGGTLQEYWSAKNAALDANGENVRKVVFAKTILVRVGEDGDVTLSQKIERSLRDRVKLAVSELEEGNPQERRRHRQSVAGVG